MKTIEELRKQLKLDSGMSNELSNWLCEIDSKFTHAVTLTFGKEEIDPIIAERHLDCLLDI